MKIYIIRHGKALSVEEAKISADAQRPLSEDGQKDIASLGAHLKTKGAQIEIIFSSPFKRANQTAQALSRILNPKSGVKEMVALNGQASAPELWHAIQKETQGSYSEIALVGHIPQLGELISWLTKNDPPPLEPGTAVALKLETKNPAQILWIKNPS